MAQTRYETQRGRGGGTLSQPTGRLCAQPHHRIAWGYGRYRQLGRATGPGFALCGDRGAGAEPVWPVSRAPARRRWGLTAYRITPLVVLYVSHEGFALWQGHPRAQAHRARGRPDRAHPVQLWQATGRVTQWQAHAGGVDILHLVPNRPILLHRRRAAVARSPIRASR